MLKSTKFVALDQHVDSITVATAVPGRGKPAQYGQIASTPDAVAKLARRLDDGETTLRFCYEAVCSRPRASILLPLHRHEQRLVVWHRPAVLHRDPPALLLSRHLAALLPLPFLRQHLQTGHLPSIRQHELHLGPGV